MKNYVVENYENYREENRLTTNNARRIEFITTSHIMDELIPANSKILDCAAGTGIYAFYLADKGHEVTATDITPRHVEIINNTLKEKTYLMHTAVLDATDMRMFPDESFDVVLNMGPFYHLLTEEQRERCMSESLRVLKKGGLIFTAYIPRFYVLQMMALNDSNYLDKRLMEQIYLKNSIEVIDHFAQDGLTPQFASKVDTWNVDQFKIWCDYHYSVCREESILGVNNHVMIVGRK